MATVCRACGKATVEITYQARAADEASRTILTCNYCPLDAEKILRSPRKRVEHRRFRSEPTRRSSVVYASAEPWTKATLMYVEMKTAKRVTLPDTVEFHERLSSPCPVYQQHITYPIVGTYVTHGLVAGSVEVVESRRNITPLVCLVESSVYTRPSGVDCLNMYRDGDLSCISVREGMAMYVHRTGDKGDLHYTYSIALNSDSRHSMSKAVSAMYSIPWLKFNIYDHYTRSVISSALNCSPRAWDVSKHDTEGHLFTAKIDGERQFIMVQWSTALMFRKGGGFPLLSVCMLDNDLTVSKPIVIDVEGTMTHGTFFIDMLTDRRGEVMPESRTILSSVEEFREIETMLSPVVVKVRKYHTNYEDAVKHLAFTTCPIDGLVSMPVSSTSVKKLKSVKAIEAKIGRDSGLYTQDGDLLCKPRAGTVCFPEGSVVEIRFRLGTNGKTMLVESMFQRPDKVLANASDAVSGILDSFGHVKATEETLRRNALLWCNSLRRRLYQVVRDARSERKIVMDVGTGTGQAVDSMPEGDSMAYILIEPDKERCRQLARRLSVREILTDAGQLVSKIKALKSRSQRYCIVNAPLSAVTEDQALCKVLTPELRYVTSFFSCHYVVSELYELCTYWGVPTIGCFYPYDGVDVGESLIDTLGVAMRRDTHKTCTVKWGGDKSYVEPHITTDDFTTFMSVKKGTYYVDETQLATDPNVLKICSSVYVIRSDE